MKAVLADLKSRLQTQSLKQLSEELDKQDVLKSYKKHFHLPNGTYFAGMSLGPCSTTSIIEIDSAVAMWKKKAVHGHFGDKGFAKFDDILKPYMSAILNCKESEIAMMNGLTVNLHLLMLAFFKGGKILMCKDEFPSDQYVVQSQLERNGIKDGIIYSEGIDINSISASITANKDISMMVISPVQYYTGDVMNIEAVVKLAHDHNIFVLLDLAHSVGNIPLFLDKWQVDAAAWCTYKYLCGGPGSIAGVYVSDKHEVTNALQGWWGESFDQRFKMENKYVGSHSASGMALSNPCALSSASLLGSLKMFTEAGLDRIYAKSRYLTGFLYLSLRAHGIGVLTHIDHCGSQLSIKIDSNITEIEKALENAKYFVDVRHDVIRVAPAALWNSFEEVHNFVETLSTLVNK